MVEHPQDSTTNPLAPKVKNTQETTEQLSFNLKTSQNRFISIHKSSFS